jgi:riboflavin kinase/FMN adenylyltransferase
MIHGPAARSCMAGLTQRGRAEAAGKGGTVQRWDGLGEVPPGWGPSAVTIGVFDGVHRGHQRIMASAREVSRDHGLPLAAVTFDPHPAEVIRPGSHPPLLCTVGRRAELLGGLGADAVCVLPFTVELSKMSPEDFVHTVLAGRLHARWVVVGENFRFGHRAAGDAAALARLGTHAGFSAVAVPLLAEAGGAVSSSMIRGQVAAGDVAGAALALGRPHRVEGAVVRGQGRGRRLGFPTANLHTPPHTAIPADGVYAGWLVSPSGGGAGARDGRPVAAARWPAAISVGTNPTFGGTERVVEAYALDRDDLDLYGRQVGVDFTARLRGMVRFSSAGELAAQMRRDADQARELAASP